VIIAGANINFESQIPTNALYIIDVFAHHRSSVLATPHWLNSK
jgi:hypothetical protein